MAFEVFNAAPWGETDPNGRITVTADTVSWNDLTRNESAWVNRAWTVAAATDIEHLLEIQASDQSGNNQIIHWAISDVDDDIENVIAGGGNVWQFFDYQTTKLYVRIHEIGVLRATDIASSITATPYYPEIIVDADGGGTGKGRITVNIWKNAARDDLLDTISVDANALTLSDIAQYLYACSSWSSGDADTADGYTKNLDLQEAATISFVPAPSVFKKRRHGLWTPSQKPPLQSRINWKHPIVRPADGATTPSLLACYLGNEKGGPQIFDIAGNNTGAFVNGPEWAPDQDGPAIEFNGVDQYIDLGTSPILTGRESAFTIVTSIRINAGPGANNQAVIYARRTTNADTFQFGIGVWAPADTKIDLATYDGGWSDHSSDSNVPVGEDVTIAISCDGTNIYFYINDVPDGSAAYTPPSAGVGLDQRIGAALNGLTVFPFNGIINYMYLFNRALSADEVFQLSWNPYCFVEPLWPHRGALWITAVGGINYDVSMTLVASFGISQSGMSNALASLTIANSLGISNSAIATTLGSLTLSQNLGMSQSALAATLASITYSSSYNISQSASVSALAALTVSFVSALSSTGKVDALASLVLNAQSGISSSIAIDRKASLTLTAEFGISSNAQAETKASLTLSQLVGIAAIGKVVALAGLTLSNILSIEQTATTTIGRVITPDERLFTITIESRHFTVEEEDRHFLVPEEDRHFEN